MSFKGHHLSSESIDKRTKAMLETRANWSDEFRVAVNAKLVENGRASAAKGGAAQSPAALEAR